jgi:hypothetical protein
MGEDLELCDAVEHDLLLLQTVARCAKKGPRTNDAPSKKRKNDDTRWKSRRQRRGGRTQSDLLEASLAKQEEATTGHGVE